MKKIVLVFLIMASVVYAITPPTVGDVYRDTKIKKQENETLKQIPGLKVKKYELPLSDDKGLKVFVKDYIIKGNTVFNSKKLLSLLDNFKNKTLTINQVKKVADIITKYYREQGFFVARAYIPVQKLDKENAVVKINILEGLYGEFKINNNSLIDNSVVDNYMNKLTKNNNVISISDLERQLLLLDELKGVQVLNTQIIPGSEIGEGDFIISLEKEPKYNGYFILDNYGNKYLGNYRMIARGYINSLNKKGDVLNLNSLVSNNKNLYNLSAIYNTPIGYDGLNFELGVSRTKYEIGKEFKSQNIVGNFNNLDIGISYPIITRMGHSLTTSLKYIHNNIKESNVVQSKKKNINSLKLSFNDILRTSIFNKNGVFNSSISFIKGNVSLENEDAKNDDTLLNTKGSYEKLEFLISQTQFLTSNIFTNLKFKAQKSFGKNLDGFEDISIGGISGVRAYNSSETSGDNGYVSSFEVFYQLPNLKKVRHNVSAFVDHGRVWFNEKNYTGSDNKRELNSLGLGYSIDYNNFSIKTSYARGFGKDKEYNEDINSTPDKFLFQVVGRF